MLVIRHVPDQLNSCLFPPALERWELGSWGAASRAHLEGPVLHPLQQCSLAFVTAHEEDTAVFQTRPDHSGVDGDQVLTGDAVSG